MSPQLMPVADNLHTGDHTHVTALDSLSICGVHVWTRVCSVLSMTLPCIKRSALSHSAITGVRIESVTVRRHPPATAPDASGACVRLPPASASQVRITACTKLSPSHRLLVHTWHANLVYVEQSCSMHIGHVLSHIQCYACNAILRPMLGRINLLHLVTHSHYDTRGYMHDGCVSRPMHSLFDT